MQGADDIEALKAHVGQLEFAVATTTCPATVAALRRMLGQAKTNLHQRKQAPGAGDLKRQ